MHPRKYRAAVSAEKVISSPVFRLVCGVNSHCLYDTMSFRVGFCIPSLAIHSRKHRTVTLYPAWVVSARSAIQSSQAVRNCPQLPPWVVNAPPVVVVNAFIVCLPFSQCGCILILFLRIIQFLSPAGGAFGFRLKGVWQLYFMLKNLSSIFPAVGVLIQRP